MEAKSKILLIGIFLLIVISVSADKLSDLEDCLLIEPEELCFDLYELGDYLEENITIIKYDIILDRPQKIIDTNNPPEYVQTYKEFKEEPRNITNTLGERNWTEIIQKQEEEQLYNDDLDVINITNISIVIPLDYFVLNGSYIVDVNGTNVTMNISEFVIYNNTYYESLNETSEELTEEDKKNRNLVIVFIVIVILLILFIIFLVWVLQ